MAKKIRNPFKKQSIIDCAINVGLGGASNVAIDYAIDMVKESAGVEIEDMYVNIGKFVIGAVGSSMVTNKYLKSAMDGVAVVGVSNLVKGLMEDYVDDICKNAKNGKITKDVLKKAKNKN